LDRRMLQLLLMDLGSGQLLVAAWFSTHERYISCLIVLIDDTLLALAK
jgi:hypothetical protein